MPLQPARFLLALYLFAPDVAAWAQTPATSPQKPAARKRAEAADPLAEARRATAVAAVSSLAEEARDFRDELLRARVQARAADALWETDKTRARSLFRRAWEAAESADRDSQRRLEEAQRRTDPDAGRAVAVLRQRPNMRREVLRLAARRERELGEEFLSKMDEARKSETRENAAESATEARTPTPRINPDDPPAHMTQRLTLARQLLEDGDTERAMQFADPALYPVNVYGVDFLNRLRAKNREAADQRFVRLLNEAANDPVADANSVSLLSSYVFTPFLYLTFDQKGDGHTRRWADDNSPPAELAPQVRAAFLRAAA
ncbi:MAG TPA: hypothetical protein VGV38_08675, partial [Pyrinomonadaceae bacterium]|nr:hypothetical protein [Pyrinomonadaceae bacterium]